MEERVEIELEREPARRRRRGSREPAPTVIGEQGSPPDPTGWPPPSAPAGDGSGTPAWVVGMAVVAVGALLYAAFALGRSSADEATTSVTSEPPRTEPAVTSGDVIGALGDRPLPRPTTTPAPTTTQPAVIDVDLGGPLLPTQTAMQLALATTDGRLLELDLDTGTGRSIDLGSGAVMRVVAGVNDTVVATEQDGIFIVSVGDGAAASPVRPDQRWSDRFPSTIPGAFWTMRFSPDGRSTVALVDLDGQVVGREVDISWGYLLGSDMAGGVLVHTAGGVYDVNAESITRLTTGLLLALGETTAIVQECDEVLDCATYRIDRASGERAAVPPLPSSLSYAGILGSISPDGASAVVTGVSNSLTLSVVSLVDGSLVELGLSNGMNELAWSDDSRYLVYLAGTRLSVFDRQTGEFHIVHPDLPLIQTFAARP